MGGSVVTFKDKPLVPNMAGIEGIASVLHELRKKYRIILVHGGGSFGHYWSVKYDMHTKPFPYPDEGIAIVHESMIKLNHVIVDRFIKLELKPYTIQPSSFMSKGIGDVNKIKELAEISAGNGLIPITFGDVIHTTGNNFSILSGDTIMSILSTILHPRYCIFATNVDGLYEDLERKELIPEIYLNEAGEIIDSESKTKSKILSSSSAYDVTGGMKRKISEAIPIVRSGSPVHLISGFNPERILDIVNNRDYVGTCIRLRSTSQLLR